MAMKSTVLLIDDNPINLVLLAVLVDSVSDATAISFEDPLKALTWCQVSVPDLIMVDYMMPGLNGHEFIRQIRCLSHYDDVPIVLVTTEDQKCILDEALALGANAVVAKPLDVTACCSRIQQMLAWRQSRQLSGNDRA